MNFIYPLFSILGEVSAKTLDKFNLKIHKIDYKQLIFFVFSVRGLGMILLILLLRIDFPLLNFWQILLIATIILVSFFQNIFEFKGLSLKDLSYRQPISDFQPLLASFMAFIIFPSERQIKYLIAILIGCLILYWANSYKNKITIDKGTWYILGGILFQAILSNLYKFSLDSIPAEYILLFRVLGVLLLLLAFTKVDFKSITKKQSTFGIISSILYLVGSLAALYSIKIFGLQFSILALMVSPVLIYWFSLLFLKEKIDFKKIISSLILIFLVLVVILL